jgi:phosphoesterase RecJ-like protein
MLREVLDQIGRRQRFVLTSHVRPDGDAVGSVLACYALLQQMGKQAKMVMRDPVPGPYRVLPFADAVIQAPYVEEGFEAAIILECDCVQRTALQGLDGPFLINIDHHHSGRPFAHVNWIDPQACATAELIFRLAREAGVPLSPEIATCLYAAVLADTGAFSHCGTNADTFALARELVLAGADPAAIAQETYFSTSAAKMRLLGIALSRLQQDGWLAWMYVRGNDLERCQATEDDCIGMVNFALGVNEVEVAVLFRELADGRWHASLRSKGKINVAEIAERFGGGGHYSASGCSLPGSLSSVSETVLGPLRFAYKQYLVQ